MNSAKRKADDNQDSRTKKANTATKEVFPEDFFGNDAKTEIRIKHSLGITATNIKTLEQTLADFDKEIGQDLENVDKVGQYDELEAWIRREEEDQDELNVHAEKLAKLKQQRAAIKKVKQQQPQSPKKKKVLVEQAPVSDEGSDQDDEDAFRWKNKKLIIK